MTQNKIYLPDMTVLKALEAGYVMFTDVGKLVLKEQQKELEIKLGIIQESDQKKA